MKLILKIAAGIILAVVLLIAGCAVLIGGAAKHASDDLSKKQNWTVIVTAPAGKCWSGAFGPRTVDGCGAKRVRIRDTFATSADAQKQTAGRWPLRLTMKDAGGKVLDSQSTRAVYGVATVTS